MAFRMCGVVCVAVIRLEGVNKPIMRMTAPRATLHLLKAWPERNLYSQSNDQSFRQVQVTGFELPRCSLLVKPKCYVTRTRASENCQLRGNTLREADSLSTNVLIRRGTANGDS